MKNKLLKWLLITSVIMIWTVSAYAATHYVSGTSSVDAKEIRWWWSTIYTTAYNYWVSTWNNLWGVYIRPDNASTIEDLTLSDTSVNDWSWAAAYWSRRTWADTIKFNKYYMNQYTSTQQKNVVMHELWHSLWLAHSILNNIMYTNTTTRTTLWTQDISDYNYLWKGWL